MTYCAELWSSMFGAEIHPLEQRMMDAVLTEVDRDSSVALLAAVMVRMLFEICYMDKGGPFRILNKLGQTAEEHRRMTALITETYAQIEPRLSGLNGQLARLENALQDARELALAKTGYHPMFGFIPDRGTAELPKPNPTHLALLNGACFVSCFLGVTASLLIFG